nr:uncharacterized protein LOC115851926 [Globicephala melas]
MTRSSRGWQAEEERRLARARPQRRGNSFIPSRGRSLPRRAGALSAGGCARQGLFPGDRFRAGSRARSDGCKHGGALCPPAPGRPGRAAGGAGGGGGAVAAPGSGGGGAPAPRAPPLPGRPALSVFVLMEPACSWRVSSHVPWAGGGWGAGGEGVVTHASGGPAARGGPSPKGRGGVCPRQIRTAPSVKAASGGVCGS